jgi:hypothetical protein
MQTAPVTSKIANLAAEMGVTPADLQGWITCVGLWVRKGYTFEAAVRKHMDQMERLIDNAMALGAELKPMAVDAVYSVHGRDR